MSSLMFREVTPYVETSEQWNDVTISAGASQSTLQDIKFSEVAGCFTYQNSRDLLSTCSNRFIYWRTNHDVIELVEVSLDINLQRNHLRLRFQNTPILHGVSIHEHRDQVVLLVATVSAIHKLIFPHPSTLENDDFLKKTKSLMSSSIFHDTTSHTLRNRSCNFVLNNVSIGIPLPHTSCSWLNLNGSATFILANSAGSVLSVVMSNKKEVEITTTELMKTGSFFRMLTGLVPTAMRSNQNEVALSIVCHKDTSDMLIFSLFSDLQIRVWSSKKQECVLVDSILNFDSKKKLIPGNFTAHQCQLKKSASDVSGNFYLGVYVPISQQKFFYIFRPVLENDHYKLVLVSQLHQAQYDLVDFCVGEKRIWTLWLSCKNQPVVLTAMLDSENQTAQLSWLPVTLEPRVSGQIDCGLSNPQDVYIKEIFKIGRFLPSSISKAIGIHSSAKHASLSQSLKKSSDLKNQVIETVTSEILLKIGEIDSADELYLNVSAECWRHFFSDCIQYHEVEMKPLGISLDPKTGCVILIKKNFFSLLCPCDSLDIIMNPNLRSSSFLLDLLEETDIKLYPALKNVLSCMDLVLENIETKQLLRFDDKVTALQYSLKYASQVCQSLDLELDGKIRKDLQSLLPSNVDIIQVLQYLLKKLDLASDIWEFPEVSQFSSFAGSSYGIGALCAGLTHFAKQRFNFCRDLLLFEFVVWNLDMDNEQLDSENNLFTFLSNTTNLLRFYYMVWWCTTCECLPVPASIQDSAFKQFCVLELPEFADADFSCIKSGQTICNLFFQEEGGVKARKIMEANLSPMYFEDGWKYIFPSLVMSAAKLLWPVEENLSLPEFLFTRCQYLPLQEYDSLVENCSTSNRQFINFLVGCSCLVLGKSNQALDVFLEVSKEIEGESYLCNKLIKGRYSSTASVFSQFCMRVIRMFEQFSLSECIVNFTKAAINDVDKSDSNLPIFYSVIFKHNLNLNQTEEAFATLLNNPDSSRRKDCLRQLIVRLCETKQFQKIIELSYKEYEEEIISILESRARCSDLCHNTSFYGVLYSLHIDHKKFRKAAAVMYELAMRFGREVISLKGLKKQVSCYLATVNCLHLAEPGYAWIVKPAIGVIVSNEAVDYKNSPKRNSDGSEVLHSSRPVKVEVLGLSDIMREYSLVQARLVYVRKYGNSSNFVITPLTAEETVALLLNGCLFESAIILSKSFSLSLVPVFEALTYRCLGPNLKSEVYNSNELDKKNVIKPVYSNVEFSVGNLNSQQSVWNNLKKYISENELDGKSELHKCVTEKLLVHGAAMPAWLKLSYQKRNFTELLHLYISHGLLEESLVLLTKYVKAVLGIRKEDFDLKFSLHNNSPPVWLPHTYIDILLDAVDNLKDEYLKDTCQVFIDALEEYNKTLDSISQSKLSKCF